MIRVTVKMDTETATVLEELTEKINRLTPEQYAEFERLWLEATRQTGRDLRSERWLNDAIAAYERQTGHKL